MNISETENRDRKRIEKHFSVENFLVETQLYMNSSETENHFWRKGL